MIPNEGRIQVYMDSAIQVYLVLQGNLRKGPALWQSKSHRMDVANIGKELAVRITIPIPM